jgi:hypothetical protein
MEIRMRALLVGLVLSLVACGSDVTSPDAINCESEKRAELMSRFGADFTPTDELLRQNHWTIGALEGGTPTEITWAPDCTMTVR